MRPVDVVWFLKLFKQYCSLILRRYGGQLAALFLPVIRQFVMLLKCSKIIQCRITWPVHAPVLARTGVVQTNALQGLHLVKI